jgi:hypothetical protein
MLQAWIPVVISSNPQPCSGLPQLPLGAAENGSANSKFKVVCMGSLAGAPNAVKTQMNHENQVIAFAIGRKALSLWSRK